MTTDFRSKLASQTPLLHTSHSFGVTDERGRTIGAVILTSTVTYEADTDAPVRWATHWTVEPGTWYEFRPWATRNGHTFGAVQRERRFKTEAAREAAIAKYLVDAKKRALKIAARANAPTYEVTIR